MGLLQNQGPETAVARPMALLNVYDRDPLNRTFGGGIPNQARVLRASHVRLQRLAVRSTPLQSGPGRPASTSERHLWSSKTPRISGAQWQEGANRAGNLGVRQVAAPVGTRAEGPMGVALVANWWCRLGAI